MVDQKWRVIITDTERETGIAPVCTFPAHPDDKDGVYDCCDYPQIECWNTETAERLVKMLNGQFDEIPEAIDWARKAIQFYVDKAEKFVKDATIRNDKTGADRWKTAARYMKTSLLTGSGCTIGPFDHRKAELEKRMVK